MSKDGFVNRRSSFGGRDSLDRSVFARDRALLTGAREFFGGKTFGSPAFASPASSFSSVAPQATSRWRTLATMIIPLQARGEHGLGANNAGARDVGVNGRGALAVDSFDVARAAGPAGFVSRGGRVSTRFSSGFARAVALGLSLFFAVPISSLLPSRAYAAAVSAQDAHIAVVGMSALGESYLGKLRGRDAGRAKALNARLKELSHAAAAPSEKTVFDSMVELAFLLRKSGLDWRTVETHLEKFTGLPPSFVGRAVAEAKKTGAPKPEARKSVLSVETARNAEVGSTLVVKVLRDGKLAAREAISLVDPDGGSVAYTSDASGTISLSFSVPGIYKLVSSDGKELSSVAVVPARSAGAAAGEASGGATGAAEPARRVPVTAAPALSVEAPATVQVGQKVSVRVLRDGKAAANERIVVFTPSGFSVPRETDGKGEFFFEVRIAGTYQLKSGDAVLASVQVEPLRSATAESAAAVAVSRVDTPFVSVRGERFAYNTTDPIGLTQFLHDGYRVEASFRAFRTGKLGVVDGLAFNVFVVYDQERKMIRITDELAGSDVTLTNRSAKRVGPGVEVRAFAFSGEAYARIIGMYEDVGVRQLELDGGVSHNTSNASDVQGEAGVRFGEWFEAFVRGSNDVDVRLLFAARGKIPYSVARWLSYKSPREDPGTVVELNGRRVLLENPNDYSATGGRLSTFLINSGVDVLVDTSLVQIGEWQGRPIAVLGLAGGGAFESREYGLTTLERQLGKLGGSLSLSDVLRGRLLVVGRKVESFGGTSLAGKERRVIRFEGDGRDVSEESLKGFEGSGELDLKPLLERLDLPSTAEVRAVVSGSTLDNGEQALNIRFEGRW